MIHQVYTVRDAKAELFATPFFVSTRGLALRSFTEALMDKTHPFSKYPADFTLYFLGEYDDVSGLFTNAPMPQLIGVGTDYLNLIS